MQAVIYASGSFYGTCSDTPPFPYMYFDPVLFLFFPVSTAFFQNLSSDRIYVIWYI